jgi:hypothetical protein
MADKRPRKYRLQEYWELLLKREGLSMERGRSKRTSYVGGSKILEELHGAQTMGTRPRGGDLDISYPDSEK